MVGGVAANQKFVSRIFHFKRQTIVATALRCARFKALPIEIIAGQKVAAAFEATEGEQKNGPGVTRDA